MTKKEVSKEVFTQEMIAMHEKSEQAITKTVATVEKGYLKIVGDVARIYNNHTFSLDGYKNMYDYSKDKFSMSRGTVSNLLKIYNRFYDHDTYKIMPEFTDLSLTALITIAPLTNEQVEMLPDNYKTIPVKELVPLVNALLGIGKKEDQNNDSTAEEQNMEDKSQFNIELSLDSHSIDEIFEAVKTAISSDDYTIIKITLI